MADKQAQVLLNETLKNDELPIAVELAEALRADEVEKFLELYDNIPKTLEFERVDSIKEMARQLAALPKKQFEMYRTKPKTLVSRESFVIPPLNTPEKLAVTHIETKPKDLELKEIFLDMSVNSGDSTEIPKTKSAKKKSKKKKKKAANSDNSTCNDSTKDPVKDPSSIIENKLLDPNESTSRIATMNKTMVADISVSLPAKTSAKTTVEIQQESTDSKGTGKEQKKQSLESEDTKQTDSEQYDTPEEMVGIAPPFGYPLSTDKLIQSAIELLSCEPTNNIYAINNRTSNQQPNELQNLKDTSNISMNSSLEIDSNLDCDSGNSTSRSPDPLDVKLKTDESVDGDVSAFDDDEGWQSQGRRSHRRKKKEFQSRERSNSKTKDFAKEPKQQNNFKRQNPRNSHSRSNNGKTNFVHNAKAVSSQSVEKENIEKMNKSDVEVNDPLDVSLKDKENNESSTTGAVFSYRDALLKVKPKTEELQYNSDSGVDVNSVGSCDSAIHSPKMIDGFDLDEAVAYFMKGWEEVRERHKKGKVVYHKDEDNSSFSSNKKKNSRKFWHSRQKHQIK